MSTIGNPIFNWGAPCLEQELIRWEDVIDDNFRVNKTENEVKTALIRGWIADKVPRVPSTCISISGQGMNGKTMS